MERLSVRRRFIAAFLFWDVFSKIMYLSYNKTDSNRWLENNLLTLWFDSVNISQRSRVGSSFTVHILGMPGFTSGLSNKTQLSWHLSASWALDLAEDPNKWFEKNRILTEDQKEASYTAGNAYHSAITCVWSMQVCVVCVHAHSTEFKL